ncbi:MAG: FGGY-family carbohydrate kinase [Anaerolineae bacterium]|nr:MAG: FGGY-family carbohydrate kinase [Anaerolineae bacterium]
MNPLVVGIDSSTTACKAIVWDRDGRAAAEGRASYSLLQPQPKWYEQDADAWWGGTCAALREALDQVDDARLEALCITHQRESFVPVDWEGRPVRRAILWLDERSHAQVDSLRRLIGPARFHRITGKPLTTNPSLTKIVWLMQHEPEVLARTYKFLDAHAFLVHRLTGILCTSLASADPMGLLDMRTRTWAADLMAEVGLRIEQFPELVPPGAVIGRVSEAAAAATGLPVGLPVVAGAGDGQCAGLGANTTGGGRASLNLGTAVVSGTLSADYLVNRAFRTLYAPLPSGYFLETVIQGGVFTVNWFVDKFAADLRGAGRPHSPEEMLEAEAAQVPPGSLGLVLVPYWNHAMTPYWDPAAAGITVGWTGAHGRAHFYRAILEGIAFEQRLAGDAMMAATGEAFSQYVALGGGSRSDLWCQIVADVTGVPVVRSATAEATCLGAGILAAAAAGWYPDPRSAADGMTRTTEHFTPDPERQVVYDRLYSQVYQPLFPALQPLVNRLTELTRSAA